MSLTQAAILSSFSTALILAVIYGALFAVERRQSLGIWGMVWGIYSLRFLCEILGQSLSPQLPLQIARQITLLVTVLLAVVAGRRLVGGAPRSSRLVISGVILIYLGTSIITGFGSAAGTITLFVVTGACFIWLGWSVLRDHSDSRLGHRVAGYGFIAWGIHKLDYPFLSHHVTALSTGYLVASLLNLVVAVGILLVLYERVHADLLEREARYRGVFNNHHTIMLLIDPATQLIADANEAAATFYGYTVAQLKRLSYLQLTSTAADQITERARTALSGRPGPYLSNHLLAGGLRREVEVFAGPILVGERTYLCAVVHDVSDRIEIEQGVRRSEEKFRMIFNNSGDAIFVHDSSGTLLEINRVARERLGHPAAQLAGMCLSDVLEASPPGLEGRGLMDKISAEGHYAFEGLLITRSGRRIPTEINGSIIEYNGHQAVLSVARDITKRKMMETQLRQSLGEQEVLIKEIHHRVKNNLQVIDSLLRLQSRSVVDPRDAELFQMSQNRIHTMALVHEQLYRAPHLSKIRMRHYLASLIDHLRIVYASEERRLVVTEEISNVVLDIEVASPCALIVNELMTNALKHAFPAGCGGRILVRLSSSNNGEELLLEVSDDGNGLPDRQQYEEPSTFGFILVRSLASQLGARLHLASSSDGTSVSLQFCRHPRSGR